MTGTTATSLATGHPATDIEALPSASGDVNKGTNTESLSATSEASPSQEEDDLTISNAPRLPLHRLFWFFFYNFGLFAWGGPVAQIALIKEKLVVQDKWITLARFQRVFAVYQILPGPEAAELCMFFGCLSAGRIGGIVAGLAFILPGFTLMLVASYLYSLAGFENKYVNASFRALQPIVAAMILRAVHKIADHSVVKPQTKKVDPFLIIAMVCTMVNSALRINIFISLAVYGILYMLISRRLWIPASIIFILQYVVYAIYVVFRGVPSPVSLALGIAKSPSLINLFVLGLVAGTLSFGGAYTAIPFIQVEAVLKGGWLSQRIFIDCIAIGNVLPAPLVIFATFVGFQGGLVDGGLGNAFGGAVEHSSDLFLQFLASFFDGLCGSVIGVIAIIAFQILKSSVRGGEQDSQLKPVERSVSKAANSGPAAVLYLLTLGILYKANNKWVPLLLVVFGSVAGQFIFVD
ncbi:hypothetical protein A7D00_0984 [Trichophyton violaceum]|uniref:Chromate transporter n=1 Tax=Trichophyton violaceum TaxID=34388 RepID=A0A178FU22_TRIVO|nr:hypothetical protein A7D00_0984 [Trichophyton violaceum]